MSIVFSMISQSLFPKIPPFLSVLIILFFIVISVVFDMIGVAFTSLGQCDLSKYKKEQSYEVLVHLAENTDKISSFCGDIVGDICGILSGAGGVSLVLNLNIIETNINFIVTCVISSIIAGITIFGKAIMKGYAVKNCELVSLKTAKILKHLQFSNLKGKNKKKL